MESVCCSTSSSNCCFLTCKQIFQEAGQVVLYSHLFQNFPQFVVIHPVKGLIGLHRTIQLQLIQHYWSGHRLGLLWCWMVCLGNEQRSFCHFEIASKYCILDSLVDYNGYSISSNGFLPTVVDIMVIWVKLLWPVCSLGKTLLTFALLHSGPQGHICLLLQVFLDFLLLHSSPL